MTAIDFISLLPHTVLLVWATLLLLVDLVIPKDRKGITAALAALGLAISLGLVLTQIGQQHLIFNKMAVVDGFSTFLNVLFLVSGLAAVAIAPDYLRRMNMMRGEYFCLLLFSISGMMLMASAADLIIVFLALELLSIPLYILAGFAVPRSDSEEAAMKYFLLGTFASGFILYGTSLIYGATGFTDLKSIIEITVAGKSIPGLMVAGAGLLLIGFGFKVAVVPFHMWTPDVYQGAPSPVTGFMSVGAKAAGFAALLRVFTLLFPHLASEITPILTVLAALTMIVGNIAAVTQGNIKRMLAYSSIAHAGYLIMAFVTYDQVSAGKNGIASILFYLVTYALTSLGAWAVVTIVEKADGKGLEISDYAGLGRKYPLLAAAMTVFMLSFTGVPPLLGFWGKLYLFRTAIEGGYLWLAIIGLLTSLASAWYYLRVVVVMYMNDGSPEVSREFWVNLIPFVMAVALVVVGLLPWALLRWALASIISL